MSSLDPYFHDEWSTPTFIQFIKDHRLLTASVLLTFSFTAIMLSGAICAIRDYMEPDDPPHHDIARPTTPQPSRDYQTVNGVLNGTPVSFKIHKNMARGSNEVAREAAPDLGLGVQHNQLDMEDRPLHTRYARHETRSASWFESVSASALRAPPDFSSHPPAQIGDVFMHKWTYGYQLWVLRSSESGQMVWKRVAFGYIRASDGRRLSVTADKSAPRWLTESLFQKTKKERQP